MSNAVIAGVDLGRKTGLSVIGTKSDVYLEELSLIGNGGRLFYEFQAEIYRFLEQHKPDILFYEYVRRHLGTKAAHAYGGYRAYLLVACYECGISCCPVQVQAIKKLATGNAKANKSQMIMATETALSAKNISDNEADAYWVARTGKAYLEQLTLNQAESES
jgi:Holliday junction resolvasome RuvABC endonuclease subunit